METINIIKSAAAPLLKAASSIIHSKINHNSHAHIYKVPELGMQKGIIMAKLSWLNDGPCDAPFYWSHTQNVVVYLRRRY